MSDFALDDPSFYEDFLSLRMSRDAGTVSPVSTLRLSSRFV